MAVAPGQLSTTVRAAEERQRRRRAQQPTPTPPQPAPVPAEPADWLDRFAGSGETLVGWLGRRYTQTLTAGWDPRSTPITVIHDLATSALDDRTLSHALGLLAPLQQDLVERLTRRNQPPGGPDPAALRAGAAAGVEVARAGLSVPAPGEVLHALGGALAWPVQHLVGQPLGFAAAYLAPATDWVNQVKFGPTSGDDPLERLASTRLWTEGRDIRPMPTSPADAWRRANTGHNLGGALASLAGVRPGDASYDQAVRSLDLVGGFAIDPLILAGKVSEGYKLAKSLPAGEAITGASKTDRALDLMPESADVARSKLARRAYQVFARNPADLAATPKARAAFEDMAANTSAAYIADRYRLDADLAQMLAVETDPLRVRDRILAAMAGASPQADLPDLTSQLAANSDKLTRLKDAVTAGKIPRDTAIPKAEALLAANGRLLQQINGNRTAWFVREMPRDTLTGWARQVVKRGIGASPAPLRLPALGGRSAADIPVVAGETGVRRAVHPALCALHTLYQTRRGPETSVAGTLRSPAATLLRSLFEVLPSSNDTLSLVDKNQGRVMLERVGHLLKLPRADLDGYLDGYLAASSQQEAYKVYTGMLRDARRLHPELQEDLLSTTRTTGDSLYHASDALEGGEAHGAWKTYKDRRLFYGQPQLDSELATELPVPSVDGIRDLLTLSGRSRNWLRSARALPEQLEERLIFAASRIGVSPKYLISVLNPLDHSVNVAGNVVAASWAATSRFTAYTTRVIWKPAVMLRLGFTQRQLGEEHVALGALGLSSLNHPVDFWRSFRGRGDYEMFADAPEDAILNYARREMEAQPTATRVRLGDHGYSYAWRGELRQLAASRVARLHATHVAVDGEGDAAVERTLAWLRDHPEGKQVWSDMADGEIAVYGDEAKRLAGEAPTDADIDLIQRKWIAGIESRIREKTRGNPALLQLIRDGELRMPVADYAALRFGGEQPGNVKVLVDEVNAYNQASNLGPVAPPDAVRELEDVLAAPVTPGRYGLLEVRVPIGDDDTLLPLLDRLPDDAKPSYVKGAGVEWKGPGGLRGGVSAMFDFIAGKPINHLSRVPAYRQLAAREYRRLTAAGWATDKATDAASKYAVKQLQAYMFELGERSAMNEAMRVVAPFMNAWQQAGRRWLIDIPGVKGAGIGQAFLVRRAQQFLEAAKLAGWVHDNADGETVATIPGLDWAISHITGQKVHTEIPLERFTMLGQVTPGIGPITNLFLANAPGIREQWNTPGPLRNVLNFLQPYGPESSMGPAWLNRVWWGLFKNAPPWEQGRSADYQRYQWQYAAIDAARAVDLKHAQDHNGQTWFAWYSTLPQGPEKTRALQTFLDQVGDMNSHFYIGRGMLGWVLPGQPNYEWPGEREALAFRDQMNSLAADDPKRQAMLDRFLHDRPDLAAFLSGKSRATPFGPPLTGQPGGSAFSIDDYQAEIRKGVRTPLTVEEWTDFTAGASSYQLIQVRYHDMLNAAGTTAAQRLNNYAQVRAANNWRKEQIHRLEVANPHWAAQHDIMVASARQAKGAAASTWKDELAANLGTTMAEVENHLAELDPDGDTIDLAGFKQARRAVFDLLNQDSDLLTRPGVDGDVARYFRDVSEPYYRQLDELFAQAKALPKGERAPVYEQMRRLANDYEAPPGMPTPEAVAFAGLSQTQKADKVARWATNPPGWLSDFQRTQLGLEVSDQTRVFWDTVNQAYNDRRKWLADNYIASNSNQAQAEMEALDAWRNRWATAWGLEDEVARAEATPFDRAWSTDQLTGEMWGPVRQVLTIAQQALAANSTSADGTPASIDSAYGRVLFDQWFVPWLEAARRAVPELDSQLGRWGRLLRPDDPLVGTDLYRRFMFDAYVQ